MNNASIVVCFESASGFDPTKNPGLRLAGSPKPNSQVARSLIWLVFFAKFLTRIVVLT